MQPEHHAFSPKPEQFRQIVQNMNPYERHRLFSHDFGNILFALTWSSYRVSKELGKKSEIVVDAIVDANQNVDLADMNLREGFIQAIEALETAGSEFASGNKVADPKLLAPLQRKFSALRQLAPIFIASFDYFSTLDPELLESLRSLQIDVRELCDFNNIAFEPSQTETDHIVDGAQAIILFNLMHNADKVSQDSAAHVRITGRQIKILNHSGYLLSEEHISTLQGQNKDFTRKGLFISAFYASEIGDVIELEQSPIDESDKSRGYQISMTLQRNQSTY